MFDNVAKKIKTTVAYGNVKRKGQVLNNVTDPEHMQLNQQEHDRRNKRKKKKSF
jgi:hypothetical protein